MYERKVSTAEARRAHTTPNFSQSVFSLLECHASSTSRARAVGNMSTLVGSGRCGAMAAPYLVLWGDDVPGARNSGRVIPLWPVGRLEGARRLLQSSPTVLIPWKYSTLCKVEAKSNVCDPADALASLCQCPGIGGVP